MLTFSQRGQLIELFLKWAKENNVNTSPFNVIVFLCTNNLMNEDRVTEFLSNRENFTEKSVTPSGITWKDWEEFWA